MLVIDCITYDVGLNTGSFAGLVDDVISKTKASWESGADVVVFPEYTWVNAVQYASPMMDRHQLANAFWKNEFSKLQDALSVSGKTVVLGTVPRVQDGALYNTCPVFADGKFVMQDKLSLTPWEEEFTGGSTIEVFKIGALNCAALICLDSEMPDLSQVIKGYGRLDILFVPSATETMMGVERIARCSSARAVELGCAVVTCGLTGGIADYDFIDENYGRAALYLPSLAGFENDARVVETSVESKGGKTHRFEINEDVFAKSKLKIQSTNPALVGPKKPIKINGVQIAVAA